MHTKFITLYYLYNCHDQYYFGYCGNIPSGVPSIYSQYKPKHPRLSSSCHIPFTRHINSAPYGCPKKGQQITKQNRLTPKKYKPKKFTRNSPKNPPPEAKYEDQMTKSAMRRMYIFRSISKCPPFKIL